MNEFTIIMYHQVIKPNDKLLGLKGLSYRKFRSQISLYKKKFNILDPEKFFEKLENKSFEKNDCILTFDDGYKTNIKNVIPILGKNSIKAFFFPVINSTFYNKLLNVNKIQLILANTINYKNLYLQIKDLIKNENKKIFNRLDNIISKINTANVFDNKETIIIKRLLQLHLPKNLRESIIDRLFKLYVSEPELKISKRIYMSVKDLSLLKKKGHHVGLHSISHPWLSELSYKEQKKEILNNIKFFKKNNLIKNKWMFCYPYGSYNKNTLSILKSIKCTAALTVINKKNKCKKFKKLELYREDCNNYLG
jgi:peptidoglycan/xylan/chitin deacetylase (PgdA/CDA1 family)